MRASVVASSVILAIVLAVAPARAQRDRREDESADLVEQGRVALRAKRYGAAADALDQAIALNPRRIEAYVLRAAIHALRREYARGIRLLQRAHALDPDNVDVMAALGAQLYLSGAADDGAALLARVVAKEPRRYQAQALLGRHHVAGGRWGEAIVAIEAYLALRPVALAGSDPVHQARLAEAYLRAGRAADARRLYAVVLEARPREPAARLGLAWALAAIDCRKARRALAALDDLVDAHPQILLVRGQCELAVGEPARALALGEAYLARGGAGAPGQALVGEAAAAAGDLPRALEALGEARRLEPTRRRWRLKLAIVLRRSGEVERGLAELEAMGAPDTPADDPAWWRELGDALIARGRESDVATRLASALAALPDDGGLATVAGEAALRAGDVAAALTHLEAAERTGSTSRSRAWLARALAADAARRTGDGDLTGAEVALARADQLGGGASVARNLGVVRLALGRGDALGPLQRAAAADPSAETLLALGRAQVAAGDRPAARATYAQAARRARAEIAVRVAIDRAALELEAGQPAAAVDAIDDAAAAAKKADGALAADYRAAGRVARHAAGLAAMHAGAASRAMTLLEAADKLAGGKDEAIRCDLALATVVAGEYDVARRRLRALARTACPFAPPGDTLAVPILLAFLDGLDARTPDRALARLGSLEARATGPTRALLATATRILAIAGADRAYRDRKLARARTLLLRAKRVAGGGDDELAHDLAVLDVAAGKLDDAERVLEKLAPRIPEALIQLGVIADRRGDGAAALDRWREARRAGAQFAPLDDWITAKERIHGGGR